MRNRSHTAAASVAFGFFCMLAAAPLFAAEGAAVNWPAGKSYDLPGLRVTLSAPALVGRAKHHFWYPQVVRLPDGPVVNIIRLGGDTVAEDNGVVCWSDDAGRTWGEPLDVLRHHNQFVPGEPLDENARVYGPSGTSSYTELALLDGRTLLFTYDRNARAWPPTEKAEGNADTDSIWVVRVMIEPRP